MTDAIYTPEDDKTATCVMQQQAGYREFETRTGSERSEARLPDAISLPMTQYFQQPSRHVGRVAR